MSKKESVAARFALKWIRKYQANISPNRPPCCRFLPTCSAYAVEAIRRHGAWRAALLTLWRVLRCNPWGGSGYDPVPERFLFSTAAGADENEKD